MTSGADSPQHGIDPRVLARTARHVDARTWSHLIPGADVDVRNDIVTAFATWILAQRRTWACWQDAWNAHTQRGYVDIVPSRCQTCRGRGFTTRHRPGVCPDCHGNRRGQPTRIRTRPAPIPQPAGPTGQEQP